MGQHATVEKQRTCVHGSLHLCPMYIHIQVFTKTCFYSMRLTMSFEQGRFLSVEEVEESEEDTTAACLIDGSEAVEEGG